MTTFSLNFRTGVCRWLVYMLLISCSRSGNSYRRESPKLEIGWENENAEDRRVYTGGTEMRFHIRSTSPITQPFTLQVTFRDGYTNRAIHLPVHHGKSNTQIDTVYRITTKTNINAYDDHQVGITALLRVGKQRLSVSKKYNLGMSLNWLVRTGNCTYTDALGNSIEFGSIEWHYMPARHPEGNAQPNTGGVEIRKRVSAIEKDSLLAHVRRALRHSANLLSQPDKGAAFLRFRHGSWQADYLINTRSIPKQTLEDFIHDALH